MTYPDREFVKRQYLDASRLNARIGLHERVSANPQGLQAWVFDHFDLPEEASILAVGCGSGLLWKKNLNRVPRGWGVTRTDASPGMLEEARADLSANRRFGFWNADIQPLPSGDGCFDAVVANHMLYHVPDRARAISEISRILRPRGTPYATTNGREMHKKMGWMQRVLDPARPSDAYFASSLGFSLENGADQLSACFTEVTEVEPLVDYLLSGSAADAAERRTDAEVFERRVGKVIGLLEHELDSQGAIHITKDTGLFVARN